MKRNYIFYILTLCAGLLITSCTNEEDDLFSKSAAERLNEAIKNSKEALIAAPNGWVMEYFPTPIGGGYAMLVKFEKNGSVTVSAQNKYFPQITTSTSTFDVIGDQGPVITFDSENEVLHLFSYPKDPEGGNDKNGLGLEGDYEFVVTDIKEDLITLAGKKRGTRIYLRPLSENTNWDEYIGNLYNLDKFLFDSKVPYQYLNTESGKYRLYSGESHVFLLTDDTDDYVEGDGISVPFIVTPEGIKTYSLNSKDGNEFQILNLNSNKSELVAQESSVTITGLDFLAFFTKEDNWKKGWEIDADNIGGTFKQYYAEIVKNYKETAGYNEDFEGFVLTIKHLKGKESYALTFSSSKGTGIDKQTYPGMYMLESETISGSENLITFTDKGTADLNGEKVRGAIGGMDQFIKELCNGSFVITPDSPLRPSVFTLTSKSNSNNWFKVVLK
ncbi:DUF4302 domain-containing protein [Dysgonomonas sp. 520]|uniref:DUF4302 domain-containing protein n=1 Tax=Dysgonomonas sp. 520 TaxID=2302931 RepID=UPI0013CFD050|nr:DUF4302 domain-containing protein [Dysgonomonas sp. 520]NDW10163.1 DUF4302 domain-containing protein [Dysgonomonas sp. 520]